MERYKNLGGDSDVSAYELGDTFIRVKFKSTPRVYVYTYILPGQLHVEKMKSLAVAGHGLQAYINHYKMRYERTEF